MSGSAAGPVAAGAAATRATTNLHEAKAGWKQPLIAVDVVAVRCDTGGGARTARVQFATHTRQLEPFGGKMALPGVLLLAGEPLGAAAARALASKLGVAVAADGHSTAAELATWQFGAFDGTNRDPRGATISIGHIAVLPFGFSSPDAAQAPVQPDVQWHDVSAPRPELPFDHGALVEAALAEAARRMWVDHSFTRTLLGSEFTTRQALAVSEQLRAILPDRATNMARWLRASGGAERVGAQGRDSVWQW